MARHIDENKMIRINDAATELIVEKGYGKASISAIAKKAGVAEGYLYRFHSSKQDMVNALLYSKIEKIIDKIGFLLTNCTNTADVITQLIHDFFEMANDRPVNIKFLYVLMHDYTFMIGDEQRKIIHSLLTIALEKGKKNGEIGEIIREEEMFNMVITYPIVFLNLRLKNFFGRSDWNEADQNQLTEFCIKALNV